MEKNKKIIVTVACLVVGVVIGCLTWFLVRQNTATKEAMQQVAELQLMNEQLQLTNEYDELSASFTQHEGQMVMFNNDSIRAEYEAAKNKVEELRQELKRRDKLSSERIAQLQAEIATLKQIMRHYVEQINELNQQNEELRRKNETLEQDNKQLSSQVTTTVQQNKQLTEKVQLAEKLNVSSVSLTALKGNGKTEKNITKAKQLMVTFTVPQNNSTPVGKKTIYLRITSPEGNLLSGNGIHFSFEGSNLEASAQKTIEYEGQEMAGVKIYWDVNATLNPGSYRVELFADNYRLASRNFEMKK